MGCWPQGGSEESRPSPKVQLITLGITELLSGPSLLGAGANLRHSSQQGGQEKAPVIVGWGDGKGKKEGGRGRGKETTLW